MHAFAAFPTVPRTNVGGGRSLHRRGRTAVARACAKPYGPVVALTREEGKNGRLDAAIKRAFAVELRTVELPCVATSESSGGLALLREAFAGAAADWLVVSSPESARIVLEQWERVQRPRLPAVAAIGAGTAMVLTDGGVEVCFEPSKASFNVLASELPYGDEARRVLYPASAKASDGNVRALEERGFVVRRIDTYTTSTKKWTATQQAVVRDVTVATFASPTTVRGWVANASLDKSLPVACIGSTSADAALRAGFTNVHYPEAPGMKGWVEAIRDALRINSKAR